MDIVRLRQGDMETKHGQRNAGQRDELATDGGCRTIQTEDGDIWSVAYAVPLGPKRVKYSKS